MREIMDTGKVWLRGKVKPDYALRVGDIIFVPGKDADDEINCWLEGDFLCVDLQDQKRQRRIARKFPLQAAGTAPAALFSGFTKTKHADIIAVTQHDPGVEEYIIQGEDYSGARVHEMSCREFWKKKAFSIN